MFKLINTICKYFIFYKIYKTKSLGTRIRLACESLSVVYIKIGQILSTRYDLLSQDDCRELQKLLDRTKELPYETIEKIIKKEIGLKKFKSIDKKPIASASISQVHKGILKNGDVVAIKVKRPNINKEIKKEIR